jgi:hypothetical protein
VRILVETSTKTHTTKERLDRWRSASPVAECKHFSTFSFSSSSSSSFSSSSSSPPPPHPAFGTMTIAKQQQIILRSSFLLMSCVEPRSLQSSHQSTQRGKPASSVICVSRETTTKTTIANDSNKQQLTILTIAYNKYC